MASAFRGKHGTYAIDHDSCRDDIIGPSISFRAARSLLGTELMKSNCISAAPSVFVLERMLSPKGSAMNAKVSLKGRIWREVAVSTALMGCSALATAANLGFLMDTPISYMKQRDLQKLNEAAQTALDTKQDGESLDWNNAGTGNSVLVKGTITPSDTTKDGNQTCRKVGIIAQAKGQTQTWTPIACRGGTDKWKLKKQ